jgi:hypothetical protein
MQDLIAGVVSLMLIEPIQAGIADRLAASRAPQAVISELAACAGAAAPAIVARAAGEPWWTVSTAFRLWAGWTRPETVLAETAPDCAAAIAAARPFLAEQTQ